MKWEIEVLSPSSTPYVHHNSNNNNNNSFSNWLLLGDNNNNNNKSTKWTPEENKLFENALALHDKDTPDRWHRVAEMIPGKTVLDVMKQYKELEADVINIEAGLVPIPGYRTPTASPFTLDWVSSSGYDGFKGVSAKRSSSRTPEQERKKGVPWTEEEHKLFLLGLKKYGKGDWRNISRNFVITRTPTQVASHAQKYFLRQLSGGKDKRRASIHDITTVNLTDNNRTPPSEDGKRSASPHHSMMLSHQQQQPNSTASFQWNNNKSNSGGVAMTFSPAHDEVFMSPPYGVGSYGLKMQGQNMHKSALHESSYLGHHHQTQNSAFQMQPSQQHYSHA